MLRRLSGDAALGDDLAQDAFVKAWQTLRQLREAAAFGGWLRQVAVTVWLQHARRKRVAFEAFDDREIPTDESGASIGQRLDVESALARLRAPERLCLVLPYSEGMSQTEIAAIIRLPLGIVKSDIARGTTRLKQWFDVPVPEGVR